MAGTALHGEFTLLARADGKCVNWEHRCLEGLYYRYEGGNLQRHREASKAERESSRLNMTSSLDFAMRGERRGEGKGKKKSREGRERKRKERAVKIAEL